MISDDDFAAVQRAVGAAGITNERFVIRMERRPSSVMARHPALLVDLEDRGKLFLVRVRSRRTPGGWRRAQIFSNC